VGTCAIGTSNAQYGGDAQFGTGVPNNCGNQTPIGQEATLYEVAQGGGADTVIAMVNPTPSPQKCAMSCTTTPVNVSLSSTSSGCK
jgi:hypothetical protein